MYIKINPKWLEKSKTPVELFSILNSKMIKINHIGEIESWSLKLLNNKDIFIKKEDWSIFFEEQSFDFSDLYSLQKKIDLILINFSNSKNQEAFNLIKQISIKTNEIILKKKDLLSFDGTLSSKIILRTLLVSKMAFFFPFIRKCLSEEELVLTSILCDISLFNYTDESLHHLQSARMSQKFVSNDVYLGILHHHEMNNGNGPFKYDSTRSHIYGQIVHMCDDFIESLKSKQDLAHFISAKHDKEIILGLKQTYKNLF